MSTPEESFRTWLERYRSSIEASIDAALPAADGGIGRMLRYHFGLGAPDGSAARGGGGKRIRPVLLLMACDAARGSIADALPLAVAVELLHNFTLIHDDIEDFSDQRHHRDTLWKVWGVPLAINAGDALHVLARASLTTAPLTDSARVEAHAIFDRASAALCNGQHADMEFERQRDVSAGEYLEMIDGKTAHLIAASLELGVLAAGGDAAMKDSARRAGMQLGAAFQIHDDVLGIWGDEAATGKSASSDIVTRKKSLPILLALDDTGPDSELARAYDPAQPDAPDPVLVLAALERAGARAASTERAAALLSGGSAELERAFSDRSRPLQDVARFLVTRTS